ncbi:tRNA(Ile)-lysidine synthase [Granulicella pectinivorans]|uniref:tRNA(Ile)-lysidine synthase n=1 Tax=Granulicella pectinivorans TaxID=474950 RepID=A0A1I6M5A2_9BACT|nr:tRNA lysidine(34) synthetase TilS [Granulicella pectinivorans]SFS10702.1 tRNA(Ile)-lysidine synthase [Granulicella pectinivorans]
MLVFDRTYLVPGTRVCVAVSGGADSVALLTGLHAANSLPRNALGIGLAAVHVNHGLRAEAAEDAAFVQALCERLGVPLEVSPVDTPGHVARTGETVEEGARTLRYGVFSAYLSDGKADVICTAHTLDDQAETVLMKLLRGAWTEGLSGVHPVVSLAKGKIVRPLLGTTRAMVEAWLGKTGQDWREDASNVDPAYTRNRLRHHVLPMLREENPSLDRTLANLAELAREEEAKWTADLGRLLPQVLLPGKPVRGGGRAVGTAPGEAGVAIEVERLKTMDGATRRRVLRAAARQAGARLSFDETDRLLALCGFRVDATVASKPGTVLALSQGLRAERSVRELRFSGSGGRTAPKVT